jgi:serine/threonine protein kinase
MIQDPLIGRQLGNYRVDRLLGRGGMALVYHGWDVKLDRPVAIKVLDARYRNETGYAERFLREAQAVATWRHENIIQVYYADQLDGFYYFVMEYIDGLDLEELLAQYAADGELMSCEDVCLVSRAIASALDYAHQKGVIHRDVKPSNVMVTGEGRVVLTDFGLAMDVYQGSLGQVFGSPHYIAPEQARSSAEAVPQSDLYSLGVMLYEMLTGVVPFDDPSATSLALQHLTRPPPAPRQLNPSLAEEAEAVLLKALSKSPEERYQTGAALVDALEAALQAGQPVPVEPVLPPPLPAGGESPVARSRSAISVSEKVASRPQAGVKATSAVRPFPAQDSLLNLQLDEYRLEAMLGRGGMARIYRGLDVHLERHVAIKVIDTPFRADSDYAVRFEREAQAIAKLEHPHIVRLYRYGRDKDLLYMAMQYVDGADLEAILDSYQADREYVEPEEAARIVRQICLALDYAHAQGVIHRDVKPSNVMLDRQGRVYLTDFGLALLTEIGTKGEVFGSPHYIAPEQAISSANVVPQSDLYAVGVILYEMFTGQPPFDAQDPLDVAMLQMREPPPAPRDLRAEIGPELEEVILKALEKQPQDRYQSGAELADALDRALGITKGETRSPSQKTIAYLPSGERADRKGISWSVPVPAAVVQPIHSTQEKTPAAAPASSAPARRRGPILIYAGLGLGACVLVTVLAVVAWLLTSGTAQRLLSRSTPTETPSPIPAVAESETSILPPLVTATAARQSPTVAPPTVVPTPTAILTLEPTTSYEILIAKRAEEGLFVINGTAQNLPLTLLQLGDGAGQVDGADWGVPALSPGDCVVAWGDKGEPRLPDKVECNQVGNVLIRSKPAIFWEQLFYVYYDGEAFGGCDKGEKECPVHISTGAGYTLHIAKRGEESLFVLNLSPVDLALSPLQLGDDAGQVSGADWGEPTLANGECVTVWKDDGDPHPPESVLCKTVGERLTRGKGDRFWRSTFDVYYDGGLIGTCEKDRKHCFVHIPGN